MYKVGNAVVNLDERSVLFGSDVSNIEPKAAKLLSLFIAKPGELISREDIQSFVYQNQVVSYSAINRLIADLRKVFKNDQGNELYIKTIPKSGYKLDVPVIRLPEFCESENQSFELDRVENKFLLSKTADVKRREWPKSVSGLVLSSLVVIVVSILLVDYLTSVKCEALEGWLKSGSHPDDYTVCTDVNNGAPSPSAYLSNRIANPLGFTAIVQNIWEEKYRGKQILFKARVKSKELTGNFNLFARSDIQDSTAKAYTFMNTRKMNQYIGKNEDWKEFFVILDVPEGANTILFGATLAGAGEVWVDSFEVKIHKTRTGKATSLLKPRNLEFSKKTSVE